MHVLDMLSEVKRGVIPDMNVPDSLKRELRSLQEAKDKAVPNRDHQGPVFTIGEVLEIRGGKFRVNGITRKRIYLDSIPS